MARSASCPAATTRPRRTAISATAQRRDLPVRPVLRCASRVSRSWASPPATLAITDPERDPGDGHDERDQQLRHQRHLRGRQQHHDPGPAQGSARTSWRATTRPSRSSPTTSRCSTPRRRSPAAAARSTSTTSQRAATCEGLPRPEQRFTDGTSVDISQRRRLDRSAVAAARSRTTPSTFSTRRSASTSRPSRSTDQARPCLVREHRWWRPDHRQHFSDGNQYIRSRGTVVTADFDWGGWFSGNTFETAVMTGPDPANDSLTGYTYACGSYSCPNTMRIGAKIQGEVDHSAANDIVLVKEGDYTENVLATSVSGLDFQGRSLRRRRGRSHLRAARPSRRLKASSSSTPPTFRWTASRSSTTSTSTTRTMARGLLPDGGRRVDLKQLSSRTSSTPRRAVPVAQPQAVYLENGPDNVFDHRQHDDRHSWRAFARQGHLQSAISDSTNSEQRT